MKVSQSELANSDVISILCPFPLGLFPGICSRFFLLSLKGGLFLRHLEQNKYIFEIRVQRLESVRQGKNNGASVF